jgi:hypothetical protein
MPEGHDPAMTSAAGDLTHTLRRGRDSDVVEGAGRGGLVARGVLYLLVAFLAAQMAFGSNDKPADKHGALRALADHPLGKVVLVILAFGFAAYALWRLADAVAGHRTEDNGAKRWAKRAGSLGKAAIYAALAATAASTFLDEKSGGAPNQKEKTLTGEVLAWPAGPVLVGLGGTVAIGIGCYLAYRGMARKFEKKEKTGEIPGWLRPVARALGVVGHTARGVVVGLIGLLLIRSAMTHDPNRAEGVDGTLRTIAAQSYGRAMLLVAAAGLAAYGLHSMVESRYRRT